MKRSQLKWGGILAEYAFYFVEHNLQSYSITAVV